MGLKRWIVSNVDKEQAAYIADSYGYPPLLALLLATRGICGREEIEDFLSEGFFFRSLGMEGNEGSSRKNFQGNRKL